MYDIQNALPGTVCCTFRFRNHACIIKLSGNTTLSNYSFHNIKKNKPAISAEIFVIHVVHIMILND